MEFDAIRARDEMLLSIRRELMGPDPKGETLHVSTSEEPVNEFLPYVEEGTGQEILAVERPMQRYGVAVLHPKDVVVEDTETAEAPDARDAAEEDADEPTTELPVAGAHDDRLQDLSRRPSGIGSDESDAASIDMVDTTRRHASSMAISFRVRSASGSRLKASLPRTESRSGLALNGRYEKFSVKGLNPETGVVNDREWWVRRGVSGEAEFELPQTVPAGAVTQARRMSMSFEVPGPLQLEFIAYVRRFPGGAENDLIVTVVLANRTPRHSKGFADELCLFQVHIEVDLSEAEVVPLPGARITDESAESLDLIYAKAGTLAIGHGCAADWRHDGNRTVIAGTHFPVFETSSLTPELKDAKGVPLSISMSSLADDASESAGLDILDELVESYSSWLIDREAELDSFDLAHRTTAERHHAQAREMLARMQEGVRLLRDDALVRRAFKMMNRAMFLQQTRSRVPLRKFVPSTNSQPARFDPGFPPVAKAPSNEASGAWRPFQIGFILAALPSTAIGTTPDRDLVDLIWFPTGGGKTEAYLGLAALSGFLRRLRDREDAGTDVIMRYTLRLLTAQQFQRASSLVCAMNYLRRENLAALGDPPFSIGLWVGGSTTPNNWQEAVRSFKALTSGRTKVNPFLVTRCPWCGAEMGAKQVKGASIPLGYKQQGGRVKIHCPDSSCQFHDELPLRLVDEDIYERPPSIVIGTVDKFAQLSWRDQPRALFGLNARGARVSSPPNLIIQDELHLITGPLGTMVGAFEPIVEHLCRVQTDGNVRPKIVCSTATIRNYDSQVRWLFGRVRTSVFPPPMFDIEDSFFGVKALRENGSPAPGRTYVGIFGSALGSHMAVQVRAYAAVLQGVLDLPPERRDPYWTLLGFFNTLRDLGSTTTMLKLQIQSQLDAIWRRAGILGKEHREKRREQIEPIELTGRLRSEEVPEALDRLSARYGQDPSVVDVCLASNMIEVGIDIDRLGMMVVTGQPKTNAQYIQVTGRVGRDWSNRPGIVLVVYSPNRARDRSVFESFRTNHERMYAAVEPASVTPFSLPSLRRTLHASMVAFARQTLPKSDVETPERVNLDDLNHFREIVKERIAIVDPGAESHFEKEFARRVREWKTRQPMKWNNWSDGSDQDVLMVAAGEGDEPTHDVRWRTPQSLRNVDSECLVDTNVVIAIESQGAL